MKIRYTDTATVELENILEYIAQQNPAAAIKVAARIEQTISVLADFPDIAQTTDELGVRRMPVGRFPFLIFYTVENVEIVVLYVRHSAREPM